MLAALAHGGKNRARVIVDAARGQVGEATGKPGLVVDIGEKVGDADGREMHL